MFFLSTVSTNVYIKIKKAFHFGKKLIKGGKNNRK